MLLPIPPSRVLTGLLHGVCTIVLRMRKCGLTDDERMTLDLWFLTVSGRPLARAPGQKKDAGARQIDGKLEIEKLDLLLAKLSSAPIPARWQATMQRVSELRNVSTVVRSFFTI